LKKKASNTDADFEAQKEFSGIINGLRNLTDEVLPESFDRELAEKIRTVTPKHKKIQLVFDWVRTPSRKFLTFFGVGSPAETRGVQISGYGLRWTLAFAAVIVVVIGYKLIESLYSSKNLPAPGSETTLATDTSGVNSTSEWNALCANLSKPGGLGLNTSRIRSRDFDVFPHQGTARTSAINRLPDSLFTRLDRTKMYSQKP
jgi:hypothetical protein